MANAEPKTDHLTPWVPGQSGNPNGRPPKRVLSHAYDTWLRSPVDPKTIQEMRSKGIAIPTDAVNADVVAMSMGRQAIVGNVLAAKELGDRTEGKATQRVELLSHEDRTVDINVTFESLVSKNKPVDVIDVDPAVPAILGPEDSVADALNSLAEAQTKKEIANANGNGHSAAKSIAIGMAIKDGEGD